MDLPTSLNYIIVALGSAGLSTNGIVFRQIRAANYQLALVTYSMLLKNKSFMQRITSGYHTVFIILLDEVGCTVSYRVFSLSYQELEFSSN